MHHIYFRMVCQKLCQNRVSGWGSLEESVLIFLREHSSFEFWIIAIRSGKSTTSCRGNRFFFNAGKWLSMGSRLWTVCRLWWNRCQLGVLRTASVTVGNPDKNLLGGLVTWILWLSIYWEFHHPNWRTHIFQRGWLWPPTRETMTSTWGTNWFLTETVADLMSNIDVTAPQASEMLEELSWYLMADSGRVC